MSAPSPQPQDDEDSVANKKLRPSDEGVAEGGDDDDNGAQPQSEEDALMEEEHLVWRKNAPFLYVGATARARANETHY